MAIIMEVQGFGASTNFKIDDKKIKVTPTSPFQVPLKVQGVTVEVKPQVTQDVAQVNTNVKQETSIQRSLRLMEESYQNLRDSVNLKKFDPQKIEDYIVKAEKRNGAVIDEADKVLYREWAKTGDPQILKALALELRVGISEKAEKEAMASLGRLVLHRSNTKELTEYMQMPDKDPNIKAHIRTILMMSRVEDVLSKYERVKRRVRRTLTPFSSLFPPVANSN